MGLLAVELLVPRVLLAQVDLREVVELPAQVVLRDPARLALADPQAHQAHRDPQDPVQQDRVVLLGHKEPEG